MTNYELIKQFEAAKSSVLHDYKKLKQFNETLIDSHPSVYCSDYPHLDSRTFIFICGMPRSGTTFFKKILNKLPHHFIYNEMYSPNITITPALFCKRETLEKSVLSKPSNINVFKRYKKFNLSKEHFIGCKLPSLHNSFGGIRKTFEGHKVYFLHLLRDVSCIVESYAKRACNPKDKWPKNRDWKNGLLEFSNYLEAVFFELENPVMGHHHQFVRLGNQPDKIKDFSFFLETKLHAQSTDRLLISDYLFERWDEASEHPKFNYFSEKEFRTFSQSLALRQKAEELYKKHGIDFSEVIEKVVS